MAGCAGIAAHSTFTLPVQIGQPYGYKSIENVAGSQVIKAGPSVTYYRKTFVLNGDTGVMARFRSYMDDGMEIYVNGFLLAREDDRTPVNFKGVSHDLLFNANGTIENGYLGGDPFDFVNSYSMDDVVHAGTNELIVVIRNFNTGDRGGFSFRMDLKTNVPNSAILVDELVSDIGWTKSTVTEATTSGLYPWPGAAFVPHDSTFTLPVEIGQPFAYKTIFEVPGSQPIKASENVTFYKQTFELSDHTGLNARFRTTFNDNVEIYVNGVLLAREKDIGALHGRNNPPHDLQFLANGTVANGFMGGKPFDYVTSVDLDTVLQTGTNCVILAIRNRPADVGGFSFRMDLDKGGSRVIVQKNGDISKNEDQHLRLDLYPNPADHILMVLMENAMEGYDYDLCIFDVSGKMLVLKKVPVMNSRQELDIDVANLAKGVYYLRVREGEKTFIKRFLKL